MPKTNIEKKEEYIQNSIGRIQGYVTGMCIGANLIGSKGRDFTYENGERGFQEIEKEIKKLIKYLKRYA